MTEEQLKSLVDHKVEEAIDNLFNEVHSIAGTISGDISVDQELQLENLKKKLAATVLKPLSRLLKKQVKQNLPHE